MFVEKKTIIYYLSVGITGFTWVLLGMGIAVETAQANSSLVPSGGEFSLTGEEDPCSHFQPAVGRAETGTMVVVWSRLEEIVGRFLETDGTLSVPFVLAEAESPVIPQLRTPKVAVLADSRFAVAWIRYFFTYDDEFHVVFFHSEGTPETPELLVARGGKIGDPVMTALPNGEVLIAWTQREPSERLSSLRFRIVRQDGSFTGIETVAEEDVYGFVDVASSPEGGFFLVWTFRDPESGTGWDGRDGIRGRAFFGDGTPASEVLEIAPAEVGRQRGVAVEHLAGGEYLLGWPGTRSTGGMYVRLWTPGEGLKQVRRIGDLPRSNFPRLLETRGHVVAAYEQNTYRGNSYLRLLDKQGTPVSAEVAVAETHRPIGLDLVTDSADQVLVVWQVYRSTAIIPTDCDFGHDIRGRYFSIGTAVPAIPTLGGAGLALCGVALLLCGLAFLRSHKFPPGTPEA